MCNFRFGTIECGHDGFCWDTESGSHDPEDKSIPCPACNTATYLKNAKKNAEATSYYLYMGIEGSGVTIWETAVMNARDENPDAVDAILNEIGRVDALFDDSDTGLYHQVKTFTYPAVLPAG